MCLWHVAYFIDARFDTLSSLLFIFLGIPQAVMSRSSRMASLQLLTLLFFFFFFFFTVSKSIDVSKPHAAESLDINLIQVFYLILSDFFFSFFWAVWYCLYFSPRMQNFGSCRYTVIIRTSCSSPRYTRDQISLSFGDGYRNQVKIILAKVLDHSGVTGMFPCFYFWGTSWFRVPFTTCCNIVYTFQNR